MKHVILFYRSYENYKAIDFIKSNLEEVFEDNVMFVNCFLQNLDEDVELQADAYLAVDEYIYQQVSAYVKDFHKVLKLNRSPDRSALIKISQIPMGENVLVVNDSYISSRDTINSFYEVGISHINMIPFDETLAHTGIYNHLHVAVTPAEPHLVPPHIKQVIDIGYRQVSFDTMFKLMRLLDLDVETINRNLFRHIQDVVESNNAFHSNYIYGYLKGEMLNRVVSSSKIGMILTDYHYQVVYANEKAMQIFHVSDKSSISLKSCMNPSLLADSTCAQHEMKINGACYSCNRYPIALMDEVAGYYITLQDESSPSTISNRRRGHVAKYHFKDIIHDSPAMEMAIRTAQQIAITDHTVLIRGESGTGKELVAQSIHNASFRSNEPFVAVNCASLPETLLESELFGYEAGAFTGADNKGKIGLFEQANHGTIFLDEIGDISPKVQSQLLRTIQEKQIMRVGSDRLIDVDIRLITATNRDLEAAVNAGTFRSDLFFRLNVLPLVLPPLRKRKEDIPSLMKHFLGSAYRNLTSEDRRALMAYDWPGNVRELENAAVYYLALYKLPGYLYQEREMPQPGSSGTGDFDLPRYVLNTIYTHSSPHGIGRVTVLQIMKNNAIKISDIQLRTLFSQLESEGLIEISRGRNGTRITQKGIEFLQKKEEPVE